MPVSNDAIAAVNHWRGQCLDNFARAERAIIAALIDPKMVQAASPPKLHEASRNRTRDLAAAIRANLPDSPQAKKAAKLLDDWGLRERQRNQLVHGCFAVRPAQEGWSLVNEAIEIKKGMAVTTRTLISDGEAAAFLDAIKSERKELEASLKASRV